MLCNNIFNEQNFVGTITWEKRTKAQNTKTAREMFQSKTEYILVYKKTSDKIKFNLEITGEKIYDLEDKNGLYRLKLVEEMSAMGMRSRKTMIYPIDGIKPRDGFQWKIGEKEIVKYKNRGDIVIIARKVYIKMRPHDETTETFLPFWSHFFDKDTTGTSEKGKSELTEILGTNTHEFETVKPINLIKKLLFHVNKNKKEIVLDFFAGSGTTGHAILELNKKDGGNRQFILCTNNENKICEQVTYPRIKKVIKGYNGNKGIPANLKYFKTDFVPQVLTDNDKRILVSRSTELLCLAENTFELVKQSKRKNEFAIYKNIKQFTAIIYDEDAIEKCKEELEALSPKTKTVIYVFSYDHEYNVEDFEELTIRFDVKAIPEAILNVYRKNSKLKRK